MRQHLACQPLQNQQYNLNSHITDELERMEQLTAHDSQAYRSFTYRKQAGILKKLNFKITKQKHVKKLRRLNIKGIRNGRIIQKIYEIVKTGTLQQRKNAEADPRVQVLQLFGNMHGVGAKTAQRWSLPRPQSVYFKNKHQINTRPLLAQRAALARCGVLEDGVWYVLYGQVRKGAEDAGRPHDERQGGHADQNAGDRPQTL